MRPITININLVSEDVCRTFEVWSLSTKLSAGTKVNDGRLIYAIDPSKTCSNLE